MPENEPADDSALEDEPAADVEPRNDPDDAEEAAVIDNVKVPDVCNLSGSGSIICRPILFCSGEFTLEHTNKKEDSYPMADNGKGSPCVTPFWLEIMTDFPIALRMIDQEFLK